jgi:hypothetical protein
MDQVVRTCHILGAEGPRGKRESQNTQPSELRFRALLTDKVDVQWAFAKAVAGCLIVRYYAAFWTRPSEHTPNKRFGA